MPPQFVSLEDLMDQFVEEEDACKDWPSEDSRMIISGQFGRIRKEGEFGSPIAHSWSPID